MMRSDREGNRAYKRGGDESSASVLFSLSSPVRVVLDAILSMRTGLAKTHRKGTIADHRMEWGP
jgi:hypothetical protein